ncbi:ppGpp synthetase/RelA/SpoT-type nucleotidyltransferase [Bradyrhizobium yuanmingense]
MQRKATFQSLSWLTAALLTYSRQNMLPFIARIKTIESAAEKIETGRYRSFSEIDDLVAVTLVVPTLRHEAEAIEYCEGVFRIQDVKLRTSARKPPDLFRFDSTRLYGVLVRPGGIDADVESIYDIKFEIQIRTAFEHAWIVATHPLTYKSDTVDWRRLRLAAQLKAAAEQLDLSILQFEELAGGIVEAPWPEIETKRQVVSLIERLVRDEIIPSEANPKDMSRFADNLLSLVRASHKRIDFGIAMAEMERRLRLFSADTFPRSASLLQVCMGLLQEGGLLSGPLQRYSCHVTDHLLEIFPGVSGLTPVFRYSRADAGVED